MGSTCAQWVRVACPPPPPACARFCACCWGWGSPSGSWAPSRRGGAFLCCCVRGFPPFAPTARRVRALLGGGSPSLFLPLADARVKRARPFRGSPRLCLTSVGFLHGERAPWVSVPLFRPSQSRAGLRGPMAVLSGGGPCAGLTSLCYLRRHIVVLVARVHAIFGPGAICTVEVLWPGAFNTVSRRHLHHCNRRRCSLAA